MNQDPFAYTDSGNAQRFVHLYGDRVLYSERSGWWVFTGKLWERSNAAALNLAVQTIESIAHEGQDDEVSGSKDAFKWLKTSQSAGHIEAIPRLARSCKQIWMEEQAFNPDPHLLNCLNGTLNLDTGTLSHHNPAHHITTITNTNFLEGATCPCWDQFMLEITDGNIDLVRSLQQIAGYAASGFASERCIFILYGLGANGKSIFLDTLAQTLGSYSATAPTQILMARSFQGVPNDVAMLHDRRFVTTAETESNQRLAESAVKNLTGDTQISARFLFGEFFRFTVHFKIFLATNHKPTVTNTDKGIWSRLRLLPFTVTIPDDAQIPRHDLLAQFALEAPGILNWISTGYSLWRAQDSKLELCDAIERMTGEYREEQDTVGAFIQECLVSSENAFLPKSDLYSTYRAWIDSQGQHPLSARSLRTSMLEHGFREKRTDYARGWAGVTLSHSGSETLRGATKKDWHDRDSF